MASPRSMAMFVAVCEAHTRILTMYAAVQMAVHVAVCMVGCMDRTLI